MTAQELYDTVSAHLLKQGKKSTDITGRCLYRGPNGLKCAIGILIADADYTPELEGCGADSQNVRAACHIPDYLAALAIDLQNIHDGNRPIYWPHELRKLGKEYNLIPCKRVEKADKTEEAAP